ncbi:MAG: hypothetical protein M3Q89_08125 [Verrucomicrobiota bacterium]|nr:hypothetical protein [Verrucomicrobiota bacterium]
MKKFLFVAFLIAAAGLSAADAQTFTARIDGRRPQTTRRPPAPVYERGAAGAFPRAARGNPIQMLNPRAPQKYRGSIEDTVTYDPYNPSRITGIILFGFRW